ncbi:Down syndrome cell adhesion molecule-like protein Dscam2 [Limulus polyphemus]|uniref:Down syndrome cell adhesion molecule-like protein Dscam2 n=1 Tax=Limulus polyphemus TaxID=6850 RepID=A0ABM1TD12_LIMPO|nr:Down syndrome cell adhesion molecule-like protein Dscam2 [Limulus polyphemus]
MVRNIWKTKEHLWQVMSFLGILVTAFVEASSMSEYRAPRISLEPPPKVTFLNNSGTSIHCLVTGNPTPDTIWVLADGTEASDIPGLRVSLSNGTLVFPPFRSEYFRQDIHSSVYRCVASNSVGKVGSRDVHLRAVVHQNYEVQVYDEFVTRGNTAILRCYIPIYVRDYVIVTAWDRDDGITIVSNIANGGRFSVLSHGELHIRNATDEDGYKSYFCRTTHLLSGESQLSQNSGTLIITEPQIKQTPRLSETRTVYNVEGGEPVELTCAVAQAYPLPTYNWYKKEGTNLIPVSASGNIIQASGSLFIKKTSVRVGGTYVCLVKNNIGLKRMETHLTVTVPLKAKLTPERLLVDAGRSTILTCNVSGFPVNTVKWVKDQRPLTPDGMKFRLLTSSSLHISSVGREDKGIYQCYVTNKDDSAQAALELVLGETAPVLLETFPDQTLNPGPSVSLHCTASGTPLPQVTWALDGYSVPDNDRVRIGDYVSRSGNVVSFVNISNVQVQDGGAYECTAGNDVGSIRHSARLNVFGNPIVKTMPAKVVVSAETSYLHCRVAGYPIDQISWEKDGRQLPFNRRQKVFPNGTVMIKELQKTKDDGIYTCTATNDKRKSASGDVQVKVKVKPLVLPFVFPENVERGMKLSAVCSVAVGDPPINVSWIKDGTTLLSRGDVSVKTFTEDAMLLSIENVGLQHSGDYTCVARNDAGAVNITRSLVVHGTASSDYLPITTSYHHQIFENGSLVIQDVTKEDEGYYLCQATNGIGSEVSGVVLLTVHVAPQFRNRFQTRIVQKNESVILDCSVTGDYPIKMTWSRDKQPIAFDFEPRIRIKEETSDGMLMSQVTVISTSRSDSALYTCKAINAFGSDESNIQLIIQVLENHKTVYNTTVSSTDVATRLDHLKPATTYELYVTAENIIGVSGLSTKVTFTTDSEAPAGPPRSIVFESMTSEAVKVTWLPPNESVRNGVIRGYYVGYKKTNSSESYQYKTVEAKSKDDIRIECVLQGLEKFNFYTIVIQAFNDKGAGPRSDPVTERTREDVPTLPPRSVKCMPLTSQSITITWLSPPQTSINGVLRGYKVFYRPVTLFYDRLVSPLVLKDDATVTTVQDLKKFTNYSLWVLAFTREGDGVSSEPVYCRTLPDVPSAPADIKAIPMFSNGILVSWRPPTQPNGLIQHYTLYQRSLFRGLQDTTYHRVDPFKSHFKVSNLEKNKRYEFWLTASTNIGEGESTRVLSQTTSETTPARIASFSEHLAISRGSEAHLPCLAVGIPTPHREWSFRGQPIAVKGSKVRVLANGSLIIPSAAESDSGNYTCHVRNTHGADEIGFVVNVQAKYTLGKGFPAPTDLRVIRITFSSAQISWNMDPRFKVQLTGYVLRYKRDFGQWENEKVSPSVTTFSLEKLSCGTKYLLQLVAMGTGSEGDPSNVLSIRTKGEAPEAPSREAFITFNSTFVILHMNTWNSGGCAIKSFIIRYKRFYTIDWKVAVSDLGNHHDHVIIQDLSPSTWYNLRITAHNSAGSTVKEYTVSTLTPDGATIAPVAFGGYQRPEKPWEELNIIIPVVAAAIALTVVLGVSICVCVKRRQSDELYERNRPGGPDMILRDSQKKVQDQVQFREMATYQRAPKAQRPVRNDPTLERDQILPLPEEQDHCNAPYATFRLPGCESDTESSQGTVRELQTFGNQYHRSFPDPAAQATAEVWEGLVVDLQQTPAKLLTYERKCSEATKYLKCEGLYSVDPATDGATNKECREAVMISRDFSLSCRPTS